MTGRLAGQAAMVTGAGSGIGRTAVELFAREGAAVAVVDIRGDAAEEVATGIEQRGGRALAVTADVSARGEIEGAVDRIGEELGHLDVLYNNAGIIDEDDLQRCFDVNVGGTLLCSRLATPLLEGGDGGRIVNQASVAALVGVPALPVYSAAKGAVVSLTRSMAVDLAPLGIRINAICPGTVVTPLIEPLLRERGEGDLEAGVRQTAEGYPMGRLGTPEEVARVALFLASEESSFLTGSIVPADGGMSAH